MASSTDQRIDLEFAIHACLEAGDEPDEVKEQCATWVDDWVQEQEVSA